MAKKTHSKRADRIHAREAKAYHIWTPTPKNSEQSAQGNSQTKRSSASKPKPEFF